MQKLLPRVKPFIQMHIFCNKQLATVWIKICVNCNFVDNRVICYIKTQLKYPSLSKLSYGGSNFNKMFFSESPNLMGFLIKSSQMLQQNCGHNKLYIFKNTAIDNFSSFPDTANIFKTSAKLSLLYRHVYFQPL